MNEGRADARRVIVVERRRHRLGIGWKELWDSRELLFFLAWRDVKLRYKQTALGASWAVLQPLLTMIVFSIFFGRLAGLGEHTRGVPYPAYVFSALVLWTFLATSVATSANSMLVSTNLVTKVYFPRLVVPFAAVLAGVVDFAFAFAMLLVIIVWYGIPLSPSVLLAPMFVTGTLLTALGVGTLLAALVVSYRDFRYVVPFLLQIWMFLTPVIYPADLVPPRWRWALSVNPMSGLVEGFRAAMTGTPISWPEVITGFAGALLIFLSGSLYFRMVERRFADVI